MMYYFYWMSLMVLVASIQNSDAKLVGPLREKRYTDTIKHSSFAFAPPPPASKFSPNRDKRATGFEISDFPKPIAESEHVRSKRSTNWNDGMNLAGPAEGLRSKPDWSNFGSTGIGKELARKKRELKHLTFDGPPFHGPPFHERSLGPFERSRREAFGEPGRDGSPGAPGYPGGGGSPGQDGGPGQDGSSGPCDDSGYDGAPGIDGSQKRKRREAALLENGGPSYGGPSHGGPSHGGPSHDGQYGFDRKKREAQPLDHITLERVFDGSNYDGPPGSPR